MPTKIEWATETWNPITGCTPISEACTNCYAKRMAETRLRGRFGYPEDEPFKVTLHPDKLEEPLRWKKPRMIFVCSMGDLFHEEVPFLVIAKIFGIMHTAKQHTYIVLTKRPERMAEFIKWFTGSNWRGAWPQEYPHVWMGVTAENQKAADERIPILLQTPAAVRFVSVEPMLEEMNILPYIGHNAYKCPCTWHEMEYSLHTSGYDKETASPEVAICINCGKRAEIYRALNWVICGGETGSNARPMHPDWVRSLRDQCIRASVPFFFKSWGDWCPKPTPDVPVIGCSDSGRFHYAPNPSMGLAMYRVGKKAAGRVLDGQTWDEMPEIEL